MHARMFMFLRIFIRDVNSVFSGGHISIYPEIFPITLFSHLLLNSYLSIQTFTQLDSDHFYSASSIPLLYILRSAPGTARILCRSFTRHRQLWVKDLPKVPTWRRERESIPRPSGLKLSTQPMRHHVPYFSNVTKCSQVVIAHRQLSQLILINSTFSSYKYKCSLSPK